MQTYCNSIRYERKQLFYEYFRLVGLGAISWHLGKKEEAEGYWKQALRIARKISEVKRDIVKISIELCQANIGATPR
jgi:hypothetical protein